MDSFGRFIVSLVSGSRERVRGDLLDFPGTASRLSPFALLLVLHPPFFTLLRGQTDQRIRRYYSNEKMFKCTDGTAFPRVLLRCLPLCSPANVANFSVGLHGFTRIRHNTAIIATSCEQCRFTYVRFVDFSFYQR